MALIALVVVVVLALVAVAVAYVLLLEGKLTIDTGWGRRVRPLGPRTLTIGAPRDVVFGLIAVPYLDPRPPRALRDKVEVVERAEGMVLAAHRTRTGRLTTVTLEAVAFEPPQEVSFNLVRGPVPYVRERFVLRELDDGTATELAYEGELGTDGWALGAWWGTVVAARWEAVVAVAMEELKVAAEAEAARRDRRDG
jgi:hypothetical protein